jgi:hypothetical protein
MDPLRPWTDRGHDWASGDGSPIKLVFSVISRLVGIDDGVKTVEFPAGKWRTGGLAITVLESQTVGPHRRHQRQTRAWFDPSGIFS